ncbi:unnamed protein product [Adineta steineri]|uniref:Uncharacterized protein n=1 Tax=Adineta steineri TaxID=433720 RepID=A0A814ZH07_9BILA|nr:unnamed protein product [Adineta steineri]
MPTSSQSQILSVVDSQLLHQQQQQQPQQQQKATGHSRTTKSPVRISVNQNPGNESKRRYSKDDHSPPPPNIINRRRSSDKPTDVLQSGRTTQRNDVLHMPVIYLNNANRNEPRINRTINTYGQTKSTFNEPSMESYRYRGYSLNSENDEQLDYLQRLNQKKLYPLPRENVSSTSDLDNINDDEYNDDGNRERRGSLLDDNARRLLVLGTIRPSKTFYKNLPDADADHLMEYFRRMKNTQHRATSEEINEELATKIVEYKPKMFFDSTCVTKHQVTNLEKIIEQYVDEIRDQKAEFDKLENPMRFIIKQVDNNKPLTTIPREYNDCFITLATRSDPLRKSDLITDLVQDDFLETIKANSLDISYFPGGVNYDVPHDDIDENGQMKLETYQKLKKRLNNRKVWYFSDPPEKRPNALLAIIPCDLSINIDHQILYDALCDTLKTFSSNNNSNVEEQILSIEFVPLSCILNSLDQSNQFIIECDTIETKRQLMEKPLRIILNKHSIIIELHSYDEDIHREYEKFIKAEKYRELIKNHDAAVKRTSTK